MGVGVSYARGNPVAAAGTVAVGGTLAFTVKGGNTCLLIRKHDNFTPTREIKRHVMALARNPPEGWNLQEDVSPTTTNYSFRTLERHCFRLQGYLAQKKLPPPITLQQACAQDPTVVLGGWQFLMSEVPLYRAA